MKLRSLPWLPLLVAMLLVGMGVGMGMRGEEPQGLTILEAREIWRQNDPMQALIKYLRHLPGGVEILGEKLEPLIPAEAEPGWNAMLADLDGRVRRMRTGRDDEDDNTCQLCQAAVTGLVVATSNATEWEEVEDSVVEACIALLNGISEDIKAADMCVGMISLQGAAVFDVLKALNMPPPLDPMRPNAESFCEAFNSCYPPGTTTCPASSPRKAAPQAKAAGQKKPKTNAFDIEQFLQGRKQIFREIFGQKKREKRDLSDAMKIAHLTDVHIDPIYAEGAPTDCGMFVCCRDKYSGEGEANKWGDYRCNTPQSTVNLFLEKVAETNPEFIIYSGDTPPHSMWEETQESQMKCTELLIESMNATLSDYRIYPGVGNHDMFPTNIYYKETNATNEMAEEFAKLWQPLAKFGQEQMDSMKEGSYYAMQILPGLRIISFNTNYWYNFNWYNILGECEEHVYEMHAFIEQSLADAEGAGDKVIMVGHHPPGGRDMMVLHTRWFTETAIRYQDTIVLHVSGHTHNDEFRLVGDGVSEAEELVLVTPSITQISGINPSARLYYIDPEDFTLLEYEQWYFDLEEVQESGGEPDIKLAYRATEEYGLSDMSPASFHDLAHRMSTDDDILHKYHYNYYSRSGRGGFCDGDCRTSHVCSAGYANYDQVSDCLNNADFPEPEEGSGRASRDDPLSISLLVTAAALLAMHSTVFCDVPVQTGPP